MVGESSAQRKLGLQLVYPTCDAAVNSQTFRLIIIAIHGLDTHSEQTFRAYEKEGDKTSRLVHWLRDEDMLPSRFPCARIYTYDWNAATISDASNQYFHHHAQELLRAVAREQQSRRNCPIIFIGSCYGGLILAKALCLASTAERYERETLESTQGVIFLGTPFRGSGAASAAHIRLLIAQVMGATVSPRLVKMLELEDETGSLANIRNDFCSIARKRWKSKYRVACFFETRPTQPLKMVRFLPEIITGLKKMVLVNSQSATLDGWDEIGLHVSHSGLSKFRGPEDPNYIQVADAIKMIVIDNGQEEWFDGTSNSELDELLSGDVAARRPPRRFASRRQKEPARQDLQRARTHAPTLAPSDSDGATPGQSDSNTAPPDLSDPEPYWRAPRTPTPPADSHPSPPKAPTESQAAKNSKYALVGVFGVAVGATADSWYRSLIGYAPPATVPSSQLPVNEETPDFITPRASYPLPKLEGEEAEIRPASEQHNFPLLYRGRHSTTPTPLDEPPGDSMLGTGGSKQNTRPQQNNAIREGDSFTQSLYSGADSPQHWQSTTYPVGNLAAQDPTTASYDPFLDPDTDTLYKSFAEALYADSKYESYTIPADPLSGSVQNTPRTDDAGTDDVLDSRYVIEPTHRFAPGEVFKVLWPEPMGEKFYVGFRRFIVVANDEGHCTCVPILTYERRACTKKGVKPNKHGIVYTVGSRPLLVKGESRLGFPPVRLELDVSTEGLAREARVNYSKLVTIEHNVKVYFIGRIVAEDMLQVDSAVDKCWKEKAWNGSEGSHAPRDGVSQDEERPRRRERDRR